MPEIGDWERLGFDWARSKARQLSAGQDDNFAIFWLL
jgi:hypothetical protein